MAVVVVVGGTGTLGKHLVPALRSRGHEVRSIARHPDEGFRADVRTGEGLAAAFAGADVVINTATSPATPKRTDVSGADQVVTAAEAVGAHLILPSIVGIEDVRFGYYRSKLAAEERVATSRTTWAIARATQFHDLLDRVLRLPLAPRLSGVTFQPCAPADFAASLIELTETRNPGRAEDFGGPEILTMSELRDRRRASGRRSAVLVPLPLVGPLRDLAAGGHLSPEHARGTTTWTRWQTELQREP